jgi:hypothetical protein
MEKHAEVGADNINDGLAMLDVILGEPFQGVQPAESYGGLVVAELFDGLAVQIGDPAFDGVVSVVPCDSFSVSLDAFCALAGHLLDALAAVGGDQSNKGTDTRDKGEDEFEQIQLSTGIQGLGLGRGAVTGSSNYVVSGHGVDHSWYAGEESVVVTVRWPSIPATAVY